MKSIIVRITNASATITTAEKQWETSKANGESMVRLYKRNGAKERHYENVGNGVVIYAF